MGGHENLTRTSRQKEIAVIRSSCEVHNESRRVTMSSAAFYESLYPATAAYLREAAPETYRATLAPPNAVESNLRMGLRSPALLASGVSGAILGFALGARLLTRPGRKARGDFAWGFALLWFGMACIVATAEACWCDPTWPLRDELYAASLSFTACACISAVAGFLADAHLIDDGDSETHGTLLSATLFILIVVTSATQRSAKSGNRAASPAQVALEALVFVAALVVVPAGVRRCVAPFAETTTENTGATIDGRTRRWCALAGVSWVMAAAAPALDAQLCVRLEGLAGSGPLAAALGWAAQVVAWGAMGAQHESGRKIGMQVVDGGHVKRD